MTDRDFLIRLRPVGPPDPPAHLRLRKLLKLALRMLRLKCVDMMEVEKETRNQDEKQVVHQGRSSD